MSWKHWETAQRNQIFTRTTLEDIALDFPPKSELKLLPMLTLLTSESLTMDFQPGPELNTAPWFSKLVNMTGQNFPILFTQM